MSIEPYQPGDRIIKAPPGGKRRYYVVCDPPYTSRGKVRYRGVDPVTGIATRITLVGGSVLNGDGILLHGKTLYVVQNQLNQIIDHQAEKAV